MSKSIFRLWFFSASSSSPLSFLLLECCLFNGLRCSAFCVSCMHFVSVETAAAATAAAIVVVVASSDCCSLHSTCLISSFLPLPISFPKCYRYCCFCCCCGCCCYRCRRLRRRRCSCFFLSPKHKTFPFSFCTFILSLFSLFCVCVCFFVHFRESIMNSALKVLN